MNTSFSTNDRIKPSQILGAMGWFDEIGSEMETPSLSSVVKGLGGLFGDALSIGSDLTEGGSSESNSDSNKLSIGGQTEIDFNKSKKKVFYQTMEQNRLKAQQAKDKLLFEEEINDISLNLSTEEKNKLLHYQASYKDRSVYQRAELRRKIIEQRRKSEKEQKATSIPSPAKKASALETAFEGASGTQGSGTANLSAHATG